MHNIAIQRAGDLSEATRLAIEGLLGRPLAADEEVSIRAYPRQAAPAGEQREERLRAFEAHLEQRAAVACDLNEEELDAAIEEALNQVRPHKPRQ